MPSWIVCPLCNGDETEFLDNPCTRCQGHGVTPPGLGERWLFRGSLAAARHWLQITVHRRPDLRPILEVVPPTRLPLRWDATIGHLGLKHIRITAWRRPNHWSEWVRSILWNSSGIMQSATLLRVALNGSGYDPELRFRGCWHNPYGEYWAPVVGNSGGTEPGMTHELTDSVQAALDAVLPPRAVTGPINLSRPDYGPRGVYKPTPVCTTVLMSWLDDWFLKQAREHNWQERTK